MFDSTPLRRTPGSLLPGNSELPLRGRRESPAPVTTQMQHERSLTMLRQLRGRWMDILETGGSTTKVAQEAATYLTRLAPKEHIDGRDLNLLQKLSAGKARPTLSDEGVPLQSDPERALKSIDKQIKSLSSRLSGASAGSESQVTRVELQVFGTRQPMKTGTYQGVQTQSTQQHEARSQGETLAQRPEPKTTTQASPVEGRLTELVQNRTSVRHSALPGRGNVPNSTAPAAPSPATQKPKEEAAVRQAVVPEPPTRSRPGARPTATPPQVPPDRALHSTGAEPARPEKVAATRRAEQPVQTNLEQTRSVERGADRGASDLRREVARPESRQEAARSPQPLTRRPAPASRKEPQASTATTAAPGTPNPGPSPKENLAPIPSRAPQAEVRTNLSARPPRQDSPPVQDSFTGQVRPQSAPAKPAAAPRQENAAPPRQDSPPVQNSFTSQVRPQSAPAKPAAAPPRQDSPPVQDSFTSQVRPQSAPAKPAAAPPRQDGPPVQDSFTSQVRPQSAPAKPAAAPRQENAPTREKPPTPTAQGSSAKVDAPGGEVRPEPELHQHDYALSAPFSTFARRTRFTGPREADDSGRPRTPLGPPPDENDPIRGSIRELRAQAKEQAARVLAQQQQLPDNPVEIRREQEIKIEERQRENDAVEGIKERLEKPRPALSPNLALSRVITSTAIQAGSQIEGRSRYPEWLQGKVEDATPAYLTAIPEAPRGPKLPDSSPAVRPREAAEALRPDVRRSDAPREERPELRAQFSAAPPSASAQSELVRNVVSQGLAPVPRQVAPETTSRSQEIPAKSSRSEERDEKTEAIAPTPSRGGARVHSQAPVDSLRGLQGALSGTVGKREGQDDPKAVLPNVAAGWSGEKTADAQLNNGRVATGHIPVVSPMLDELAEKQRKEVRSRGLFAESEENLLSPRHEQERSRENLERSGALLPTAERVAPRRKEEPIQPSAQRQEHSEEVGDQSSRGRGGSGSGGQGKDRDQSGQQRAPQQLEQQQVQAQRRTQSETRMELQRLEAYRIARTEAALKVGLSSQQNPQGQQLAELMTRHAGHNMESLLKKTYRLDSLKELSEDEAVNCLGLVLKMGGEFTYAHSARVLELAMDLADEVGIVDERTRRQIRHGALLKDTGEMALMLDEAPPGKIEKMSEFLKSQDLRKAGLLHDIGKTKIPPEILYKPGKLTEEEYDIMKLHPIIGEQIVYPIESLRHLCPIIRGHHERWDGKGYPDGLKGEAIPLGARIIAVADVFDALAAERPYKAGMPIDRVQAILKEGRGTHFDPDLVDAFERVLQRRYPELSNPFA